MVSDNHWDETATGFWTDEDAPQSPSRLRCLTATVVYADTSGYSIGARNRRAIEVSERRLSAEDKETF